MDIEKELATNTFDDIELFTFENIITKCKVVKVYDGDTNTIVFYYKNAPIKVNLRMFGYDTPEIKLCKSNENAELHKEAGLHVRNIVTKKLLGKIFWIKFYKEEKYGRCLGELYENGEKLDENLSINKWVIANGYGKEYTGGKKEKFTKEELELIIKQN